MHETSIIADLLELVDEQLAALGPVRVTAVRLRVGVLSGVEPAALRFAWDAAAPATAAAGARLDVEPVAVRAWCARCRSERQIASGSAMVCPACGRPTPDLVAGRELEFASLEVIDPPPEEHPHVA